MDIREATEPFVAVDAYGHPQAIPKSAILYSVGNSSGYMGRGDARQLASFVYLGSLFFVRKDAIEAKTTPMIMTAGRPMQTRAENVLTSGAAYRRRRR